MDSGDGNFKILEEQERHRLMGQDPNRTDIFTVGEHVTIARSKFRIVKITPKKLTLRLLPRD